MVLAYKSKKHQLAFISTWQKLIDVTGGCAEEMIAAVMKTFLNHFNVDCAVSVSYTHLDVYKRQIQNSFVFTKSLDNFI